MCTPSADPRPASDMGSAGQQWMHTLRAMDIVVIGNNIVKSVPHRSELIEGPPRKYELTVESLQAILGVSKYLA